MRAGSRIHKPTWQIESVLVLQNTCCMLLHWLTRPPTNWTLYDCAFTDEPHLDVLLFGFFYHVTFPVPKSTSTLYQSCRVGWTEGTAVLHFVHCCPWWRPGIWNEQCVRAIYYTGLFKKRKKKDWSHLIYWPESVKMRLTHVDLKYELDNICPDLLTPHTQPPVDASDIHMKCISTSGGVLRNLHRSILGFTD